MLKKQKLRAALLSLVLAMCPLVVLADALDGIRERGTIRVGVSPFVPLTLEDADDNLIGFEIDVANKIAEDMGVNAQIKVYDWEDLIPAVTQGEIDMIAAGMAITPERALRVAFSNPYSDSGITITTNTAMTRDVQGLEDLNAKDKIITGVAETLSAKVAAGLFDQAQLQLFTTVAEAQQAVLTGKAHAYVSDVPTARFLVIEHPEKVDLPLEEPLVGYRAGFAVQPGEHGLVNFLNAWIVAREADKWLSTTHRYWFRGLRWRQKVPQ